MATASTDAKVTQLPTSRLLTRESILAKDDIPIQKVFIPQWNGEVWVRGMTGTERDRWEASIVQNKSNGRQKWNVRQIRARAVVRAVVTPPEGYDPDSSNEDPTSFPFMFSEADVAQLSNRSAAALDLIFKLVGKLSGINDDDLEDLEANLGPDPSAS